jgi:Bacterial RNA polymerase, alpha chain C terminal domain.
MDIIGTVVFEAGQAYLVTAGKQRWPIELPHEVAEAYGLLSAQEISVRLLDALIRAEVYTIDQLRDLYSSGKLLKVRGIGPDKVREVQELLNRLDNEP